MSSLENDDETHVEFERNGTKEEKGEFIFSTFWQVPLIILSMKKQRRRLA